MTNEPIHDGRKEGNYGRRWKTNIDHVIDLARTDLKHIDENDSKANR